MALKLGNTDINKIYLGSNEINKAYLGAVEVYNNASAFDPDYQAKLDYATLQGFTLPSPATQIAENQLFLDFKAAGAFQIGDIFFTMATDGDSNYATLNNISPSSFQLLKVNSPIFTPKVGFKGDGVSAYLNTQYNQVTDSTNFQATDASKLVYISDLGAASIRWITGCNINLRQWMKVDANLNGNSIASTDFSPSPVTGNLTTGLTVLNKTASLTMKIYKDSTTSTTHTLSNDNLSSADGWLLSAVTGGVQEYGDSEIGIYFQGASLEGKVAAVKTAIETYLAAI